MLQLELYILFSIFLSNIISHLLFPLVSDLVAYILVINNHVQGVFLIYMTIIL